MERTRYKENSFSGYVRLHRLLSITESKQTIKSQFRGCAGHKVE